MRARLLLAAFSLVFGSCDRTVELSSVYCAEIPRVDDSDELKQIHFAALDEFFELLRFEQGNRTSNCVKDYWGRNSSVTVNVCTEQTIITSYNKDNMDNYELGPMLDAEVQRVFESGFDINVCPIPYGFSMKGWPKVDSTI